MIYFVLLTKISLNYLAVKGKSSDFSVFQLQALQGTLIVSQTEMLQDFSSELTVQVKN